MEHTARAGWNESYASGRRYKSLSDAERALFAARLPAPPGALALEVGCGTGGLARHLGGVGYAVDAVDFSEVAIEAARERTGSGARVTYVHFDVEEDDFAALPHSAYDLVVFRQSYPFVRARTRVVNRLRELLRPGGALCVITPVADLVPRDQRGIALDEGEIDLLTAGWGLATRDDADGLAFIVLRDPVLSAVTTADKPGPAPRALVGTGVIVTDPRGRVLLGRSVHGTWELPGGKPDVLADGRAETPEETAVRELREETGLVASPDDARVFAVLTDATHGTVRQTTAVHVTAFSGEPAVTEPIFTRWEFMDPHDLAHLPSPLFTPAAHILEARWPGLLPHLPPVVHLRVDRPSAPVGRGGSARLRPDRPGGG
ncbi:bifunctional class I SAM-dependent methyltransferase/NUDIX hydrolase [Streptomyces sp. NPDC050504]|uniref:bifunctional class I SAM-dependent methyltransferase/NUDIX hydrolase n=1 Tax=Streptomyces sp. NPDC050504 TaxID=3365618 RepID=UPI0037994BF8